MNHIEKEVQQQPKTEWVITIEGRLRKAGLDNEIVCSRKPCIYKVPRYLREADEKSYTPSVVSIGPYHRQDNHLIPMERHKWRAFSQTVNRDKACNPNLDFVRYFQTVENLEERARDSYEGEIDLESNEFVKMMVLDGCFILELFRGIEEGFEALGYGEGDPVFCICGMLDSIRRDMVMLENQIPMCVLEALFALQITSEGGLGTPHALVKMAIKFFKPLIPTDFHKDQEFSSFEQQPLHCLHLFRESLVSKQLILSKKAKKTREIARLSFNVVGKPTTQVTYCVSQLRECGIEFKKRETDQFWDIKCKKSILEIPRILIHEGTKSIFRNLVAFEVCHPDCSNEITAYLVFMNNLIDSAEDVGFLHYEGIIEHWLGNDNDVANLFNNLCQEVIADLSRSYLSGLTDKINKCRDNQWNTWKADLRHKYFNNPWATFSVIAAMLLLMLTILQSFYTVYSYYKPTSHK